MRRSLLALLLLAVPLAVVPSSVTFDAVKALLLSLGALLLAAMALPRAGDAAGARFDLRWSAVSVALGAVLLAMGLAAFRGPDPWAASRLLALLLAAAVVALAVENALFDAVDLRPLLAAAALAQGLASSYGLLQAAGWDFPFPWRAGGRTDPVSTLGNPNWAAEWIAASLPLTLLLALRERGGIRACAALALLLGAAFLFVARGRAAFLGLAVGVPATAAVALAGGEGRRRIAGWFLGLAVLLATVGGYGWMLARDGELPGWIGRSDTVIVRSDLAAGTARMLLDHPLGVGAGNWEAAYPPYRTEREYRASLFRDPGEAHCDPLQFAAEGGWPLVAAALALALLLARTAVRGASGENRAVALALFASLAIAVASSLASAPFHRPASLLLGAVAAGGLAFLGGGRVTTLGAGGATARRVLVGALGAGMLLLGQRMVGEGPQAVGRAILHESEPLPRGRAEEARARFARAAAIDPGAVDAISREGEVSIKLGAAAASPGEAKPDFDRAREAYERVQALRPFDPMTISNLASAHAALGEAATAEDTYRRALALAPWHRNANEALGFFLLRRGRAAEALPLLERSLAVDPLYAPAAATRAEALFALGRDGEAAERCSEDVDRLLAAPPRDLSGAGEVARRAAAAAPLLAGMLLGKALRLMAGPDREGGAAVALGVAAGRPEETLLDRAARGLEGAGRHGSAVRFRLEARFLAAEEALRGGDRERAAAEATRAAEIPVPRELDASRRVRAASVLVRAGKREAALAQLGVAVARGLDRPSLVSDDPAFAPLREDPAFLDLLRRTARAAARRAEK